MCQGPSLSRMHSDFVDDSLAGGARIHKQRDTDVQVGLGNKKNAVFLASPNAAPPHLRVPGWQVPPKESQALNYTWESFAEEEEGKPGFVLWTGSEGRGERSVFQSLSAAAIIEYLRLGKL